MMWSRGFVFLMILLIPQPTRAAHRSHLHRPHRFILRASLTPRRAQQLQDALRRAGVYSGHDTGRLDGRTRKALEAFQRDHGLPSHGKITARTLEDLGLGPQTAGLFAPKASKEPS